MSQSLARYHARSPRYILNTEDDFLIRVAGPRQLPWEEGTEIRNVSLTGLAFTAPDDLCPILGEVIRIQFTVPGGKQMACHGIVTRLEEDRPHQMLVGIHFYKLEMPHRVILAQGLSNKFREQMSRRHRDEIAMGKNRWKWVPRSLGFFISLGMWTSLMMAILVWGDQGLAAMMQNFLQNIF